MSEPLFPSLTDPDGREAIRIGDATLSYKELAQRRRRDRA